MLNINLVPDKNISVLVSNVSTTVTRVGDVVLLTNSDNIENLASRPPWEDLIEAYDWHIDTGHMIESNISDSINIIFLSTNKWKMLDIYELSGQDFDMALMQRDKYNNLQLAINKNCKIVGTQIDGNHLIIAIIVDKCEMIYIK